MSIRITAALIVILLALSASGAVAIYTPGYYNTQSIGYSQVYEKNCQYMIGARVGHCPTVTCTQETQCPPVTTCQKKVCPPTTPVCPQAYPYVTPAPVYPQVTPVSEYPVTVPEFPIAPPFIPEVPEQPPFVPEQPPIVPEQPPIVPEQPPVVPEQPPEKPEVPEIPEKPEIPKIPEIPEKPEVPGQPCPDCPPAHFPNPLTPYNDKGDIVGKDVRGSGTSIGDSAALRESIRSGFASALQTGNAVANLQEGLGQIQHSENPNVGET